MREVRSRRMARRTGVTVKVGDRVLVEIFEGEGLSTLWE